MRSAQATPGTPRRLLALALTLLVSFPATGVLASPADSPVLGRILSPEETRVLVRRQVCRCGADGRELVLLTVGTEGPRDAALHFHPLASLAFDPALGEDGTGQWMALWSFGPSAAGWRRTLHSALPIPAGAPRASAAELARLDQRLSEIRENPEPADLLVPDPVVHLASLGRASRAQGLWGGLQRGLSWAGVFNPAQFIFRTHLGRRKDRRERNFQRSYLALQWLMDIEYTGEREPAWLRPVNDLRFHLLRNRSFFGRWVQHADSLELVYNYESDVRRQLGKTSSWLQSAANEHGLRYQPIYRFTQNGAAFPLGGVLYYDPRLGAEADPAWWRVANPFDLRANPHTDPRVQALAREHPDELIPLGVYTFQTHLALRPIIAIDFFAPSNPRTRESTQQLMVLLKTWLSITTGSLSFERIPYRAVTWAANKKGFTLLTDKSSRLGIEELRVALEAGLYFDPDLRGLLLERADQRVLNPLVKAGEVEERLAHLQYESLLAGDARALCRAVDRIRGQMVERLRVPAGLDPAARDRELARRLRTWQQQVDLEDLAARPLDDYGSLAALEPPLRFFLEAEPIDRKELAGLLEELYAKLYFQQLQVPAPSPVPELDSVSALTRRAWERAATRGPGTAFPEQAARVEARVRARQGEELKKAEKKRRELLRELLEASHKQLAQARRAGCGAAGDAPAELDAHLALLQEVAQAAFADPRLRAEFERQVPRLRRDLAGLETALSRCPSQPPDPWRAQWQLACLEQTRALRAELDRQAPLRAEASQ